MHCGLSTKKYKKKSRIVNAKKREKKQENTQTNLGKKQVKQIMSWNKKRNS